MKNTLRIIAILSLVLSTSALLAKKPTHKTWNTPMIAAKHDQNVVTNLRKYLSDGFTLVAEYENAYRYFAEPEGDYLWGECVFTLNRSAGGFSLEVTYVHMTAYIDYLVEPNGYACSGFDLIEQTVY